MLRTTAFNGSTIYWNVEKNCTITYDETREFSLINTIWQPFEAIRHSPQSDLLRKNKNEWFNDWKSTNIIFRRLWIGIFVSNHKNDGENFALQPKHVKWRNKNEGEKNSTVITHVWDHLIWRIRLNWYWLMYSSVPLCIICIVISS